MHLFFRSGCLALLLLVFIGMQAQTQQVLPPFQPEQDACGAIPLCGKHFSSPYSYVGIGRVKNFDTTQCGGGTGEVNSMWMQLKILQPGTIAFTITPVSPGDDYDFAVFKPRDGDCRIIRGSESVRCNFNNNNPGSNVNGVVGLSDTAKKTEAAAGISGYSFCKTIDAQAGETYLVMINNYGDYNIGGPSSGFSIDFTGSTAVFAPNPPPVINSAALTCTADTLTVFFSNPVQCNSIAADGSDFSVFPNGNITSVASQNCNAVNGYTKQLNIIFSGKLNPGSYSLQIKNGSDQNTILDVCGTPMIAGNAIDFIVPDDLPSHFMPQPVTKCSYATAVLTATQTFTAYQWSDGGTAQSVEVDKPGIYKLTVTDARGCRVQDSVLVKDSTCPEQFSVPNAFSPNNDGINDYYHPVFKGSAKGYHLAIYNRMGQRIFESQQPANGWDGRFHGTPQSAGVYAWVCDYFMEGKTQHRSGVVLLMR